MADDQMALLRYIAAGQAQIVATLKDVAKTQAANGAMLTQIIGILTAEPDEPSDLADSVRELVATCHDIKAATDHIEERVDDIAEALPQRAVQ